MMHRLRIMAAAGALLALSGPTALAANAIAMAPAKVHAGRSANSAVVGTVRAAERITATNCRNGWCAAAGGYVRSGNIRFVRVGRGGPRDYDVPDPRAYDYNVPLAFPPYGYVPSFWGYGGRRYYDRFGNYIKYGQGDYPVPRRGLGTVETIPRSRLR